MVKPSKIQEWINEIEERPMVAPFIVRRLSERLIELDEYNEELRSENLLLRSGKKIEDYERRIAELEYQIDLLKRQVQNSDIPITAAKEAYLLAYDSEGHILAREIKDEALFSGKPFTAVKNLGKKHSDDIHLLVVDPMDELLYLLDTGRITTQKAKDIPLSEDFTVDWMESKQIEMRSGERLITVISITKLPLADQCIQLSRKGFAKSFQRELFQNFLSGRNLGKGVRSQADQLFNLTLCSTDDIFALVSQSGYLSALPASRLSISLKEIIRLDMRDYLVGAFTIQPQQHLVMATHEGEIKVQRNPWQDLEDADGGKRRLILSRSRAGKINVIGASAAEGKCWAFLLMSSGEIYPYPIDAPGDKPHSRQMPPQKDKELALAFTTWEPPG